MIEILIAFVAGMVGAGVAVRKSQKVRDMVTGQGHGGPGPVKL